MAAATINLSATSIADPVPACISTAYDRGIRHKQEAGRTKVRGINLAFSSGNVVYDARNPGGCRGF